MILTEDALYIVTAYTRMYPHTGRAEVISFKYGGRIFKWLEIIHFRHRQKSQWPKLRQLFIDLGTASYKNIIYTVSRFRDKEIKFSAEIN